MDRAMLIRPTAAAPRSRTPTALKTSRQSPYDASTAPTMASRLRVSAPPHPPSDLAACGPSDAPEPSPEVCIMVCARPSEPLSLQGVSRPHDPELGRVRSRGPHDRQCEAGQPEHEVARERDLVDRRREGLYEGLDEHEQRRGDDVACGGAREPAGAAHHEGPRIEETAKVQRCPHEPERADDVREERVGDEVHRRGRIAAQAPDAVQSVAYVELAVLDGRGVSPEQANARAERKVVPPDPPSGDVH